ncbi:MAG: tRNA (adenosine(37)-N6)-threonylcarbamoyltransferase complex ATPase subunit type 1 TsaE [Bacteroidetes bacterium GWF2_43_63]|nr:MAG: tRNA (adenosine(37)-N6)-threonylcarbamoyltransferase complex ATPase subunit type 1 TsaE [Bacteroidetes bacterium GWE2_42_42]OFY54147.1 MAG: tRNA (adenosine(37)-N6)-threonylcarbamoyltransferase complex ATPase subunit type 1 TsaE [Bacteroidetes bacterium GWF2_43_63]HBG70816.1 tRNA (adenosine(37)-N6)-threonylcarbamoyltransferase complex ATPase subunit type 1 TsaE [Bacteroidales bacterium]HCB61720.1 tRNA (adenosine(37)-N6)-threonylcarbamoyltransferase complex ATPase subunit type 1 TsaE [Bact
MKKVFSRVSLNDMTMVADFLATLAEKRAVFAFYGPMGSGKTTLIGKMIRIMLQQELDVTSPTFALINVYEAAKPVYHFDCYRIEKPEEALNAGIEEMLYSNAVCLIEWPEKIEALLPKNLITITLSSSDDESFRHIEINIPDHD